MHTPWHTHTLGSPTSPPLILLHGFMGSGADFLPLIRPLAQRYFCILPDLPGHGNTPLPEDTLSFDALYAQFHVLLQAWDITTFTLGGYSMGGRLALYIAVHMASQVQRLIVESANPGLSSPQERARRLEIDRHRAARMRAAGMQAFLREWYAMPLFANLQRHPQTLENIIAQRSRMDVHAAARLIVELSPGRQPPLWQALPTLSMPVLLVGGALDSKYTALLARMAARIPQAHTCILPQAGHNTHLERPNAWLHAIRRWLEG